MARNRNSKAQLMIECSAGLIALLPVILCLFDLIVIVVGVSVNDAACREACRVASTGSPTMYLSRANAVIAKSVLYNLRGAIGNLRLVEKDSHNSQEADEKIDDTVGGNVSGTVTVKTSLEVYPPFLIGAIHKQASGTEKLVFYAQQTMPYSFAVANESEN
ncbi:MAG: hypothetical protein K2X27_09630 [Candidatus Obscuribacterales bacterium]|nr:hypothetical protein [Candidatus Obscuribacterales bacterium]